MKASVKGMKTDAEIHVENAGIDPATSRMLSERSTT